MTPNGLSVMKTEGWGLNLVPRETKDPGNEVDGD